jgi:hypothetical protein
VTLFSSVAANSLGIARGAIDTFIELAAPESSTRSADVLRGRPEGAASISARCLFSFLETIFDAISHIINRRDDLP